MIEAFDFNLASFMREAEGHKKDVLGEMMSDRVTWCQKPTYAIDPATRTYKSFVHRCKSKDPNVCESCARQYRMDKFELVTETMMHFRVDKLVVVNGDESDLRRLRKQHGLERIIRVPKEDGITILCAVEPSDGDVVMHRDDFTADVIFNMFTTPDSLRVTGGYKRTEEEKERDDKFIEIDLTIFVIDEPITEQLKVATLFKAHSEACRRLPDLNPDENSLQDAVDQHEAAVSQVLTELGVQFVKLSNRKMVRVYVSDIDWDKHRLE